MLLELFNLCITITPLEGNNIMKIRGSFTSYPDHIAAKELRAELQAYSRDKESGLVSALDWCIFFFNRIEKPHVSDTIQKEKDSYVSAEMQYNPLKENDGKSVLQYAVFRLHKEGYLETAITLENKMVDQFGELDEEAINGVRTLAQKKAELEEIARRAEITVDKEIFEHKTKNGIIILPK